MKISSYNINGVRAAFKKGLMEWIEESAPDIICFQELRADIDQVPAELKELEYHEAYYVAEKKGYSGVAIFSKENPVSIQEGIGVDWIDAEGRVLTCEFENIRVISAYFPSGTTGDVRQDMKMKFLDEFTSFTSRFNDDPKPTVVCGDFNICHTEIDIHNPDKQHKTSGFLPEERQWVTDFLETGFEDVFRKLHPGETDLYSWWSYRAASKQRNKGWRIDYHMATPALAEKAVEAEIEKKWDMSDHVPVSITYKL
ncbi:MAG TPA: exodeoxyribonuclease III [Balneolaceae bacterium]|nr:exodeoxyribonuclease III [Balneolaceae bacterium]|tara:strand:- start:35342 stop:36106 length:765 start_codon:yes stop_codon:yes gene_type:complete